MFDIIIVGCGVAGLSAAVTAKARNKEILVIGNGAETSAAYKAERIDNYLGLFGLSGAEMLEKFRNHASEMGVRVMKEKVLQILPPSDTGCFYVNAGDSVYEAKTIILATGARRGNKIKGETEFLGKGVSYCATCDGMLYRGKTVIVTGDNEETVSDARFLSEICKKVIVISEKGLNIPETDKLELRKGGLSEIKGELRVSSVLIGNETIECDGVFIINDAIPSEALIYGIEIKDGFIVTDRNMNTNIPGVFAAGDCTGKPLQISKAAGEGLVAALSAVAYI